MNRKKCMKAVVLTSLLASTLSFSTMCHAEQLAPAVPGNAGVPAGATVPANAGGSAGAANPANSAANTAGAAGTSATGAAAQSKPIQAGVQMIEVNLETLRDLGLDLKNILKASSSLYDEVTIQPVSVMTEPEVVGYGTIINVPIGFTPTGAGPQPKKARVDATMAQMRPLVELLKKDTDDFENGRKRLDVTDKVREDLKPMLDEWATLIDDMNGKFQTLETLTKQTPYDCNSIGSAATDLHNKTKKLDEVRRKVYKVLQKDGALKKNA